MWLSLSLTRFTRREQPKESETSLRRKLFGFGAKRNDLSCLVDGRARIAATERLDRGLAGTGNARTAVNHLWNPPPILTTQREGFSSPCAVVVPIKSI